MAKFYDNTGLFLVLALAFTTAINPAMTSDAMTPSNDDLLQFASSVYAQPGIQALCLRLQDEGNADVVMLLTCCWYGRCYGRLTDDQLIRAMAFSESWRAQLVAPLRQARRWLKPHPATAFAMKGADQEALRQRIKAIELDAEFVQLRTLAGVLVEGSTAARPEHNAEPLVSIRSNLILYAQRAGMDVDGPESSALNEADLAALAQAALTQGPLK